MTEAAAAFDPADFATRFDHHSEEYGQHVNEIYDHMRDKCPIARSDKYGGFWVLTRYADIMEVSRDDETFSSEQSITIPGSGDGAAAFGLNWKMLLMMAKHWRTFFVEMPRNRRLKRPANIPIEYDPPRSQQFRVLINPLLAPKVIAAREAETRQLASDLVDAFIEKGEGDLVTDLAQPLTAIMTIRLAGLPESEWRLFSDPLHKAIWRLGTMEELLDEMMKSRKRVQEIIKEQRRKPVEGGAIAHLLNCEVDGRKLEDWEVQAMIDLFIVGGVDTTQALLGSAWVHLGRHPDRRAELAGDIGKLDTAIDEMLRFFAPQQALCRTATKDTEVAGQRIAKGEKILMCWASANRDQTEFDRPEELKFDRTPNRHMTFGMGSHRCAGSHLARMEARICMEQVLTRLPDYRLDEAGVRFAPDVGVVYGYSAVPVTFTPGPRAG
jgi:cytochrome P450